MDTTIEVRKEGDSNPGKKENSESEKTREFRWQLSELDRHKFAVELERNRTFAKVFNIKYNLTKAVKVEIKRRTEGEQHIIITLSGLTGSGKSTIAQYIADLIANFTGVPFKIIYIAFTFEELLEICKKVPKNACVIADESVLQSGMGSKREKQDIMNLENVVRKYGLNIIWVYPEENIKHPTAHLHLRTISINAEYKITKLAVKYGGTFLGYIIINVKKIMQNDIWKEYNVRKDEFIEKVLQRKQLRKDYYEVAKEIFDGLTDNEIGFCRGIENTKLVLRRKDVTHLTEKELETIARYILLIKKESVDYI